MKYSLPVAVVLLLAASSCAKNEPPGKANADVVAKVNGKAISTTAFETYATMVARRPAAELSPEQRAQILDNLVAVQLAADTAEKTGLAKKPEVETQLTLARLNVLSESFFRKYLDEHQTNDAEIKAEYDTQVAALGSDYHARHILVESRSAADALVAQLSKGADFAKLAEKNSVDGTAKSGGDMGWFNLRSMSETAPELANAVKNLEKGKITTEPVRSKFGWHIVKLDDTRPASAPAFDDVKDQLKNLVQQKKVRAYVEDLRKTAKIEKIEAPKPAAASHEAQPAATPPTEAK